MLQDGGKEGSQKKEKKKHGNDEQEDKESENGWKRERKKIKKQMRTTNNETLPKKCYRVEAKKAQNKIQKRTKHTDTVWVGGEAKSYIT